jgi:hypothetical protein
MNDIHTAPDSAPRQAWFQLDVHPYVFFISAGMIVLFVVLTLFFEQRVDDLFAQVQAAVSHYAGWFFVGVMNIVLIFVISLVLGRFGDIRLGGRGRTPRVLHDVLVRHALQRRHGHRAPLLWRRGAHVPLRGFAACEGGNTRGGPYRNGLHLPALGTAPLVHLCLGRSGPRVLRLQQGVAPVDPLRLLPGLRRAHLRADRRR